MLGRTLKHAFRRVAIQPSMAATPLAVRKPLAMHNEMGLTYTGRRNISLLMN